METLDLLRGKVVVGTHSRQIEGRFFEMLFGEGWKLEIERPAILNLIGSVSVTAQGSRNPVLIPWL